MKVFIYSIIAVAFTCLFAACNTGSHSTEHHFAEADLHRIRENNVAEIKEESNKAYNTEEYDNIVENPFVTALKQPLSTFSVDVDRAAYSNVRRYLQGGLLPPRGAVRIEEMINYFNYSYSQPGEGVPFSVNTETASCPWNPEHKLIHIGLKGREIEKENLPPANLVFLVDVSGSMDEPNKLPLVQSSLKMLATQLRNEDRVAIVVYAGSAGLVLPSVKGSEKRKINAAVEAVQAGGPTAGGEGIRLAYRVAKEHFIKEGNNRVILATDGDFNVGVSSEDELVALIEEERKSGVFLTVLGYGMGYYKDNKMQQLADKGNGNHAYIDNSDEARKVLVNEFGGTLFAIAKDVKLQVEFNPLHVKSYRLIGYENRMLSKEDFNDDKKDAGEIGAGHTVTALYEVIPAGVADEYSGKVDELKYQQPEAVKDNYSDEMMTIKLRYKAPDGDVSNLMTKTVAATDAAFEDASENFRFSAAVAEFGLLLRRSAYRQSASFSQVMSLAKSARGNDDDGYRSEFIRLAETASALSVAKDISKN
ncbi:vWA domain-containing protein [Foetidibacter luteolus]|uniref:vWA domain-containing protein n=1 Tax=Foetidibacter luteolus TaxID=2608880 RepID=UPI00129ADEC7|nr:VWA domain-containing protein [Foetidibacter luteolus]